MSRKERHNKFDFHAPGVSGVKPWELGYTKPNLPFDEIVDEEIAEVFVEEIKPQEVGIQVPWCPICHMLHHGHNAGQIVTCRNCNRVVTLMDQN